MVTKPVSVVGHGDGLKRKTQDDWRYSRHWSSGEINTKAASPINDRRQVNFTQTAEISDFPRFEHYLQTARPNAWTPHISYIFLPYRRLDKKILCFIRKVVYLIRSAAFKPYPTRLGEKDLPSISIPSTTAFKPQCSRIDLRNGGVLWRRKT